MAKKASQIELELNRATEGLALNTQKVDGREKALLAAEMEVFNLNKKVQALDGAAEQLHSVKAGKFLADRPVEGHHVPPYYCGYADARGEDQCDNCGKLLSPTEPKGLSTCAPRGRALTMCWFRLSVR